MATQLKVAQRYARAIFDLKGDLKKRHQIQEELAAVAEMMNENKELKSLFQSSTFSSEDTSKVIQEIVKRAKFSDETRRTLEVLAQAKRLPAVGDIADSLKVMLLQAEKIVLLNVSSRDELESDDKKQIEKKFKEILKKEVQASYRVEPKLIGGVRVTAEGRTYDGSLVTRLDRMRETLAGGV